MTNYDGFYKSKREAFWYGFAAGVVAGGLLVAGLATAVMSVIS
jgi:hypothetical protein